MGGGRMGPGSRQGDPESIRGCHDAAGGDAQGPHWQQGFRMEPNEFRTALGHTLVQQFYRPAGYFFRRLECQENGPMELVFPFC